MTQASHPLGVVQCSDLVGVVQCSDLVEKVQCSAPLGGQHSDLVGVVQCSAPLGGQRSDLVEKVQCSVPLGGQCSDLVGVAWYSALLGHQYSSWEVLQQVGWEGRPHPSVAQAGHTVDLDLQQGPCSLGPCSLGGLEHKPTGCYTGRKAGGSCLWGVWQQGPQGVAAGRWKSVGGN